MISEIRAATAARRQWYLDNGGIVPSRPKDIEWLLDRIDRMRETMARMRREKKALMSELQNLHRLAWSVREWIAVNEHEDFHILVSTKAQIKRDIKKALAVHFGTAQRSDPYEEEIDDKR